MIPTICFIGRSNSGKTTVLKKLIAGLKFEGYRVASIKHAHDGCDMDQEGKDSWHYAQVGSDIVAIASPSHIVIKKIISDDASVEDIRHLIGPEYDIILAEGFKKSQMPKVHLFREESGYDLLCPREELLAIVSDKPMPYDVPRFSYQDAEGLLTFVKTELLTSSKQSVARIALYVNGKSIPLNDFVQAMFSRTLQGMVSPLKGIPVSPETIEVSVKFPTGNIQGDERSEKRAAQAFAAMMPEGEELAFIP